MSSVSTANLWNTEYAFHVARQIAALRGVYCGPAVIAWIAAVWNANSNVPYDYLGRLKNKTLFDDGPRAFAHTVPGFRNNLDETLRRETQGQLRLSAKRSFRLEHIHTLIAQSGMPFIVRIPLVSLRDGLHYATIFKTEVKQQVYRCYCQDNGVISSGEKLQEGISVTTKRTGSLAFCPGGARQVERA